MKYFKHMTNMRNDPKFVQLRAKLGLKGYAQVLVLWELIAENMDDTDRCEVTLSCGYLCGQLETRSTALRVHLACIHDARLVHVTYSGDLVTIKCENLLKIRARKSLLYAKNAPRFQIANSKSQIVEQGLAETANSKGSLRGLSVRFQDLSVREQKRRIGEYFKGLGKTAWTLDDERRAVEEIKKQG
jgi:hypothetical protein